MLRYPIAALIVNIAAFSAAAPGYTEKSQRQRMKDCNAQAAGMTGDARQKFMSTCLSNKTAETKTPNCVNGKPCGNSCIAKDKVLPQMIADDSCLHLDVLQGPKDIAA
jgi:hypothetical protein